MRQGEIKLLSFCARQGAPPPALGIRKKEREGRKERKEEREKLGEVLYELIWYNSVISMVMHFFSLSCLVFI